MGKQNATREEITNAAKWLIPTREHEIWRKQRMKLRCGTPLDASHLNSLVAMQHFLDARQSRTYQSGSHRIFPPL